MTFKQIFFWLKKRFLCANYYARKKRFFSECKWRFIVCKINISILVSEQGILFFLILFEWNNVWNSSVVWFKCFGVQKSPLYLVFEKFLAPLTPNDAEIPIFLDANYYARKKIYFIVCKRRFTVCKSNILFKKVSEYWSGRVY